MRLWFSRQPSFFERRRPCAIRAQMTPREVPEEGPGGELVVGRDRWLEARGGAGLAEEPARPFLSDPELSLEATNGPPAAVRDQKFPRAISFNASMSKAWSATIFLRRWFSFFRSRRRLASSASIPPCWFSQRCQVDSEISKCLATSATGWPCPRSFSASATQVDDLFGGVVPSLCCCGVLHLAIVGRDSHSAWISKRGPGQ